jgi:hypothetical protein
MHVVEFAAAADQQERGQVLAVAEGVDQVPAQVVDVVIAAAAGPGFQVAEGVVGLPAPAVAEMTAG